MGTRTIRVVILGAGYGGLTAALRLARRTGATHGAGGGGGEDVAITVVDRQPHHLLKTRLHEAVAGGDEVAVDLAPLLEPSGVHFVQAEATDVDPDSRRLTTTAGELKYDLLVIATGARPAYRGIPGVEKEARTLRTEADVRALRTRLQRVGAEAAEAAGDAERAKLRRVVIAGGGFSGVELAAELSDHTDPAAPLEIVLLEAGERLLAGAGALLSRWATAQLRRRGVRVRTGARLVRAEEGRVHLEDGDEIEAGTLVWMGGVEVGPVARAMGAPTGRLGRVLVDETLRVRGAPGVYAIGDAALARDARGREVPLTARFAAHEGRYLGDAIAARLRGDKIAPYRPRVRSDAYNMERYTGLAGLAFGGPRAGRLRSALARLLKRWPAERHLRRLRRDRTKRRPHVVVIGGGFGGLRAARALRRSEVAVTVIDRRNHHLFQPLLYQVATATLSPADIAAPIRHVLHRQRNTAVLLAEVTDIEVPQRQVVLSDGRRIGYDFLIVAAGAVDQYFGHEEWAANAPGLKSIEDATEIRRRFLMAFEEAEQEPDPEVRRDLLTFVVVGGGPTGVEMAGAFAEIAQHTLTRDFRKVDPSSARIVLIEGGPRLLPGYPEPLSESARRQLKSLGVEVRLGEQVTRVEPDAVWVDRMRIGTRNVVWAAGVAASPLGERLGAPTDRRGRVVVEPDLSLTGHPEVFVIGDLAAVRHNGVALPGTAPVAMQEARCAVANLRRSLNGERRRPFRYVDRGSMATIGRAAAVARIGRLRISGTPAWLAWVFVHILFLVGFRNRLVVMLQWAWSYLSWQRGARLITGRPGGEADSLPAREPEPPPPTYAQELAGR